MKKLLMIVMALAAAAAFGESAAFARATGASMRLDTRAGVRIAAKGASETITYSPRWAQDGGGRGATALPACTVTADGATLKTANEEGEVEWSPDSTGAHVLTHAAGDVTYTAQFTVLGDDVQVHSGIVRGERHVEHIVTPTNEFDYVWYDTAVTWTADKVHLVVGDVSVPSGTTLTIEPGAVVKFMTGTSLAATGTCMAKGVIFTHVNDDTVGGDTLMDGDAAKPVMDGYKLSGNIYEDDATEERYTAPQTLTSSISGTVRLKGHKVYLANSSITVNSGATLTLLPGAIIKFASGCSMTVSGTLDAQGTRAAPIVFTSQKDDDWGGDTNGDGDATYAQAGDWYQIRVAGTAKFNYCQVLYNSSSENYGGLEAYGGTVDFDNSVIAHTKYECVNAHSSGTLTARNSVFWDSSLGFGYYGSGKVKAYNCVFADLTVGIRQSGKTLANCVFYRCQSFTDQSGDGSTFKNCAFYNPLGFGAQSYAKVGSNGDIWGDPKFLDPDNGDFRLAADSPCVDAGDGTVAPEFDYYGQPRMDVKRVKDTGAPNTDGICPDIGIYEFPGKANVPVADLAVLSVTGPATAVPGEEIALTYVVTNRGGTNAVGLVRDQLSLKGADAALGGQQVSVGEVEQLYSLAAGAATTLTARATCPTVKGGNWLVGVTVNAERDVFEQVTANNTGWASEPTAVELEALAAGESRVTVGAGSASGFVVAAGVRTLRVTSDAALDKVAVYGANGAVPASADGGVAAVRLGDGSWLLVLPEAKADEKGYVVIENGGATVVELKVTAEEEKLAVYGVAPGRVAAVDGVSVTITGTGLAEGQTVTLGGCAATRVTKVNEAQIVATFDLKGLAAGSADVAVSGGAGRAALPVEVYKATQGPKLEAKLELPSSVRDGRIYTAYVVYANVGDEPMTAPIFTVKRTDWATKLKILMSDDFTTGPLHIVGIGSGYPAGVLAAGDSRRIPFYFMPSGTYRLELSHAKEETAATEYRQFADTADYRQAVADAATRLSARGKAEYRVRECVNFVLAERANRDVAAISGTVLDATTRNPLAGVTVSAVMTNDTTRTASCTADADGHFSLTMLADGDWQLSVDGGVVTGGDVVTITNQKDVNGQMLTAHLLATVSGTVLTADTHEPIEGAAVRLYLNGGDLPSDETMTDTSGTFKFNGAVSGTYALVVNSKDGYVGDVVTNVVLSLGSSYAAGVFELSKGAILSGTVTQDGGVVTNGTVYAYFEDGSAARAACSTNGTYCFDGLPPYGYRVRYAGDGIQAGFVDVTLGAGETKELDLEAKATPLFFPIRPRGYGSLTTQFMVADPVLATNATAFAWDFDNDGSVDSTDEEPEWTYDAVGSYSVKLVATTPQGAKTSLYENCVTVEEAIENTLNANAFRVDETAGIDCMALGENTLTLVGTPPLTLASGVVVGGKFGDEWYIRRIKGVSQSGTTYTLTTEEATLDDLYASYCFTACAPVEVVKPVQNLKKAGPRLMAANAEGDDKLVRVYAEGGATLTPSVGWSGAYVLYDNAKPINGVPYTRIGIGGKLYFSLSGEIYVQGGVKLNPEFSFPITLPTTIPFVDAKAELIFGDYLGVEGKVSGGFEVWCNPRICMGIERWGTGSWQLLKPFDFSDRGSETHWNEVSGSIKGGAYVQIKAGLVAAKLFEVTVGPKVELSESLTSTLKGSTAWNASLGLSGVVEAGVKTENVPIVGKFLSFMDVGASLEIGMINVKLQQIKSPEPDFTASPDQGDAPLEVTLTDQSKEEYFYHIGMGDFTRRPKIYEWNLGDGSHRTWGKDDKYGSLLHRYEKEGVYEVSLKVKGHSLTGNQIATRKVYVGKEKPPEDEQQKDDQGGDTSKQSWDPNEMAGPLGTGDPGTERFVKPGDWMDYTIYFENKADADVPAQEVFVDAQLSEWLDWSTFEMGEVAFNNQNETVLAGLRNGEPKLVAQNGADYKVQLSVSFDEKTGAAHWYFRSYDPNQSDYGCWPAAVDAGFLPPNDETHRGEGHITYRVKVREDAPKGMRIDAAATIVFDKNEPIPTDPAWWNTVGADLETWPEDGDFSAKAANVYDAFLADESGNVVGTVQIKTAKQVVKKTTDKKTKKTTVTTNITATATVTANGKKWSYAGGKVTIEGSVAEGRDSTVGIVTGLKCTTKGCPVPKFGVTLGKNGLEGEWGSYEIFGARQVKPKSCYAKNWTVAFANGDWVQLKVDSKGAVKFAGSAKGKAYSGSTRILTGNGFAFIPVVSGKNATLVRIEAGAVAEGRDSTVSIVSSSSGGMAEGGVTAKPRFDGWNASANKMVGVAYKGSPVMDGLSWPLTFKASKLPTGCKINASTGVISGVPTKTGTFLTKVTATSKSNSKWTATYVVTNKVVALPEWAKGQFAGTVWPVAEGRDSTEGTVLTMSVGSTGKVSGKFKQGATNWTFSASSFSAASQTAAEPLALVCSATAKGTYKAKSGKTTVTKSVTAPISFTLVAAPDVSPIASSGLGDFAGGTGNVEIRRVAGVRLSVDGVKGGTVKMDKSYGQVASGKSVKLTATLTKGYTLLGWYDAVTGARLSQATSFSLKMAGADRVVVARFAKESDLSASDFELKWNAPTNLTGGVSYSATPKVSGRAAVKIASVTGLPSGLSYKSGKVTGVPTAVKTNTVSVTFALATNAKKTWTLKQRLVVAALPDWAKGTYVGGFAEGTGTNQVTLTVGSTGKVSGKLNFANASWTLSGTKYTKLDPEERTATLSLTAKKGTAKKTVAVTVGADELGGWAASETSGFAFEARQNLWKTDELWKSCASNLVGRVCTNEVDGLVVTFGANGTATAKLTVGKNVFTGSSVLCPTAIGEGLLNGRLYLYFAPNAKKNFKGAVRVVEVAP